MPSMRHSGRRSCVSKPNGTTTPNIAPQPTSRTWLRAWSTYPVNPSIRSMSPKLIVNEANAATTATVFKQVVRLTSAIETTVRVTVTAIVAALLAVRQKPGSFDSSGSPIRCVLQAVRRLLGVIQASYIEAAEHRVPSGLDARHAGAEPVELELVVRIEGCVEVVECLLARTEPSLRFRGIPTGDRDGRLIQVAPCIAVGVGSRITLALAETHLGLIDVAEMELDPAEIVLLHRYPSFVAQGAAQLEAFQIKVARGSVLLLQTHAGRL